MPVMYLEGCGDMLRVEPRPMKWFLMERWVSLLFWLEPLL